MAILCILKDNSFKMAESEYKKIENSDIIIEYNLDRLCDESLSRHVSHVYCEKGSCEVGFNGSVFTLTEGKCMIVVNNRFVDYIKPDKTFKAMCIYLSFQYLCQCVTRSNFGIVGTIRLYSNPIFDLLPKESDICRNNFKKYIERVNRPYHFREDMLASATQLFFLDFFEFHIRIYGNKELPEATATIMRSFLSMLDAGEYLRNREVAYYADRLCVVPKYLSEVSRRVSGYGANYWIMRYTIQDLRNHFRNRKLTVNDIARKFHFSSVAYLNRYVQTHLGVAVAELRR